LSSTSTTRRSTGRHFNTSSGPDAYEALGENVVRAYAAVRRQGIGYRYDTVTDDEPETLGEVYRGSS
jgi:hypothetical protein